MTGEDKNVMKISSYEDGDWISNYFDNRASAVQKLVTVKLSLRTRPAAPDSSKKSSNQHNAKEDADQKHHE